MQSQGLLYKQLINSIIQSWFVKISLGRRQTLVVEDGAFSHKMDYFKKIMGILNLEGHSNCITGSKVLARAVDLNIFTE